MGRRERVEGVDDNSWSEDFGEHVGWGRGIGGVEGVCGDSAAAEGGECLSDVGILVGPVGAEENGSGIAEVLLDVGAVQDEAFVDLAAEAPACCEVDEDWLALGSGLLEEGWGEGLPDGAGSWELGAGSALRGAGLRRHGEGADGPDRCTDSKDQDEGGCGGCGGFGGPAAEEPSGDGQQKERGE